MTLLILALSWLAALIFWVTAAVAALLVLRVVLTWLNANPFGWLSYNLTKLTEPMVRPLRYQFGGRTLRYDMVPLIMALMIFVTGWFIAGTISQFAAILADINFSMRMGQFAGGLLIGAIIRLLGLLYVIAIFMRFLLPMFGVGYSNPFHRFVFAITEPLLKPLRRIFVAGMFDFSPLVAMLLVQILTGILAGLFAR